MSAPPGRRAETEEMSASARRRAEIESWWALLFRIMCGFAGLAIGLAQAFLAAQVSIPLIVFAIGLCGPVVAEAARSFSRGGDSP